MSFLLLHGLGGDRRQSIDLVGPCLPADARVLAPDLRAHGDSRLIGDAADFSFAAITAELADTVREHGFDQDPLTVIGISLGAAISLRLVQSGQLPIARLVLLRPAFTDQPIPPNLALFPVIGELLHRHPADRAEAIFRRTGLYRGLRLASRLGASGVIEQFRTPDASARAVRLVELPRNRAFEADDRVIDLPTTIIAAPRDPLHPLSVASAWHRRLPASALVEVPARDDGMAPYLAATRAAVRSALQSPSPG
ncbi:MAG TPA: alpha/beta fold hydrolase [Homoserinimonas sp.]|nr:alpha/beta fold hydrolase [Homoserinimonas sp.]